MPTDTPAVEAIYRELVEQQWRQDGRHTGLRAEL